MRNGVRKGLAFSLGVTAFKNGKKRVPAHDNVLLEQCITGLQCGESVPYLKAWLEGWDLANLGKM